MKNLSLFKLIKFAFVICLSVLFASKVNAQNPSFLEHNWYFGDSPYGLIFSKGNNQVDTVSNQNTSFGYGLGGGAVETDQQTGDLLFYTDGNNVFDNSHQQMPNGFGLTSNTLGNQHTAVLPVPNQPDQYYIITNTGNGVAPGTLFYSIVNMSQDGNGGSPEPPRGDVVTKNINTGINNTSEAMLVFFTGNDPYRYWLLVQDFGTRDFRLFEVLPGNNFTLQSTVTVPFNITAGNFSMHRPTGRIAISPLSTNANVTLLNFNPGTQTLAYDTVILNTGNTDASQYAIYDTEWSNDGNQLYVSRTGDGVTDGTVMRYDINLPQQSGQLINPAGLFERSYGLKKGPDGNIYHLYREVAGVGPFLLARIGNVDSALTSVNYIPQFFGGMDYNSRQFPEFSPPASIDILAIGFDVIGTCEGNSTKFFPSVDPQATRFQWDFGDGTSAVYNSFVAPVHQYQTPGTYNVTMTATIDGEDSTFSQTVNINPSDSVDLGADTVICPGEQLVLDAGPGGVTYTWSEPGETGQTITIDSAGTYWVVVDYGTCESYDEINVEVYGEQNQFANIWYFGDGAGIDFNEQPPVPLSDGATQAPAGVSAYSDANGDIVLYSDGTTIYSRDHVAVGNNIGGDNNATQSALIIPFPNDPTMYYVFTTEDIWDDVDQSYILNYAIYDMKKLGDPSGPVVLDNKTLYYRTTERLAGLIGGNTWLLSHEFGTNTFRSYPITQDGIGNPVFSSVGSVHGTSMQETGEGYMQFDPGGQRVAVALVTESNQNVVELFDFDQASGELTNPIQITFSEPPSQNQVYGVEFSPGGNELYVTLTGSNSILYEFKLYNYDQDSIRNSGQIIAQGNQQLGAIQAGPDGQIYIASDNQNFVVQFQPIQDTLNYSTVDINANQFALTGTSGLGLPNFAQNISQQSGGPAMQVADGCFGTPTDFLATPSSMIDEFFWDYEEGSSTLDQFQHTFSAPGVYTVQLNITNRCGLDTLFVQDININPSPNEPTIPAVDVICTGSLLLDADTTNTPGLSFFWSTADTTKTISVTFPTDYWVRITDANGCQSQDTVSVYDGRPNINLPADFTVCEQDVVPQLDGGNPASGSTYLWTINGANAGTSRFINVDTSTPGTFNYRVEVTSGLTGCTGIDSVMVTVNPLPATPTTAVNIQPTCGNANGEVEITSDLTGLTFEWFDNTNASLGNTNPLSGIMAGSYSLVLTNNITGCSRTENITITDQAVPFTITPTVGLACEGDTINVSLSGVVDPNTISYTLVETNTNTTTNGTATTADFSIFPLPSGNYNLTVTADGCTDAVNGINVAPSTNVTLTVDPVFDLCSDTNTELIATTNSVFDVEWFDGTTLIGAGSPIDVSNILNVGTHTITVIARGDGSTTCDTTATTTVNMRNSPIAAINVIDDGCGGDATLEADVTQGSGNYSYSWTNGAITPVINVNTSGSYSVDVLDQTTGCPASAGPEDINIFQDIMVSIDQDTVACQDENLVTLTAITTPPDNGSYTYTWFQNDVLLQPETTATVETFTQGTFRVEVGNGPCVAEAERSVARFPNTPADIEPSYVICPEAPLDFEDIERSAVITPGNFTTYFAYQVETGQEIFETNGTYEVEEEGQYNFELGNAFNCFTFDSTVVTVSCDPSVVAPTAFSPQASMTVNQTFRIFPLFVGDFEIFIYNRWGELIFHTNDLDFMENEGWDGTVNGEVQPSGTYAYIMKYRSVTDPERGVIEKRGGVNLLR